MRKLVSIMSHLQTHYHFKLNFQKADQHTWGKWLIYGIKHCKDNQLQSLELPGRKESDGNIFNPIFIEDVEGRKAQGDA